MSLQWALVTGAGTGIGRALSLELCKRNLVVLGVGRRLHPLEETQSLDNSDRLQIVQADVATCQGQLRIVEEIAKLLEKKNLRDTPGAVVHNAAVLHPTKKLQQITREEWRTHMSINVEAPLFLTQKLVPYLSENSRILHISSGAAHKVYPGWAAYCISKSTLYRVYQVLKDELISRGIYIGSCRPGVVDTPMQDDIRELDERVFPFRSKFIELKNSGSLEPPQKVGHYLTWLLLDVEKHRFIKEEWDIRQTDANQGWSFLEGI